MHDSSGRASKCEALSSNPHATKTRERRSKIAEGSKITKSFWASFLDPIDLIALRG
jgi:hypothetical protein